VAVAFDPVRRRVQRGADRLVYGQRPTPYEALSQLSTQLSVQGQRADLLTGLASTLAAGVGAAEVTLWVGSEANLVAVASAEGIEVAVEIRQMSPDIGLLLLRSTSRPTSPCV